VSWAAAFAFPFAFAFAFAAIASVAVAMDAACSKCCLLFGCKRCLIYGPANFT